MDKEIPALIDRNQFMKRRVSITSKHGFNTSDNLIVIPIILIIGVIAYGQYKKAKAGHEEEIEAKNRIATEIQIDKGTSSLDITIDGRHFATYVWKDDLIPLPHFKQVNAPNAHQVTRKYPTDPVLNKNNDDHATYHPGIWLAFGDINGHDFWRNKARVRHMGFVAEPEVKESTVTFTVKNAYESGDTIVCYEICAYEIRIVESGYLLNARSTFSSPDSDFTFGDQEEMGLGIRLATSLTVAHGNGSILNSEGGANEAGTWGKSADWCAYEGSIDGATTGAMLIPHPDNFRKSWYHSRDYGLLTANPFGKKAMTAPNDSAVQNDSTSVSKDKEFTIGFSVLVYGKEIDHNQAYQEVLDAIESE
jgi:hypothetical protein